MQAKLTLRLEEELIEQAKLVAKKSGKSVSQMVADYFLKLTQSSQSVAALPPITSALKGSLPQAAITNDTDYHEYLERKYL
ncbi:MAG: antitoxin [Moraxellaceae bacterium]|nr:antitoxin [Moraxellaceae bacterium]